MISLGSSFSESYLEVGTDWRVVMNSSPSMSNSIILACHAPSLFLGGLSQVKRIENKAKRYLLFKIEMIQQMKARAYNYVGNKMHKAFPLPGESSHWQYKFSLPVKVVPTARRLEMPLSGVCTAIEEMMKKLPVKDRWQLH
uniref:Reverse transcriptase domain-containing protein n=1 Tax=Tanacetum cinerariifolium TaxID=118510 RepID=A0A6L2LI61_TANCI|nr:hypothetical protein [Tanacetum cinerariifolium]